MSIGPMEIILVLVIALLVFGPNRLPQAGRNIGRAVREFRRATESAKSELGLDEVIDEFKGVKDSIAGEYNGVKGGLSDDLQGTGATEALGAIKSGLSIDLKSPGAAITKSIIGAGAAASGAAAVDKPVHVAPAADEDDAWLQGIAATADFSAADAPAVDEPAAAPEPVPADAQAAGAAAPAAGRDA